MRLTGNAPHVDDPADMLARLNSLVTPTIDDWVREPDVHARLVRIDLESLAGLAPNTSSPSLDYNRSLRSSSMAPVTLHQHHESMHPPSLTYSNAHTNAEDTVTESSISTGLASQFTGVPLLDDNNGVLERPLVHTRAPYYQCVFWFLECEHLSRDEEQWGTHCLSHFRGEEPPATARCPLCEWTTQCEDGWTAWSSRMEHLASSHLTRGETLKNCRPDFDLFQHLWRKRLIDEQDLKELMGGNHNLTHKPSNFVTTNGRNVRHERGRTHRQLQHIPARALHMP